jgi:AraC-like DNA-binding protein
VTELEAIGEKSGYLKEDFKLFHIRDKNHLNIDFHYHEFNKIVIFLSGNVTYIIEGKAYKLKPWDILLVNNHDVHKPVIDPDELYDRIILWVNSEFIEKHNYEGCDLGNCFKLADEKSFNLVRLPAPLQNNLKQMINDLDVAANSTEFGSRLMKNALFMQLLIYINRIYLKKTYLYDIEFMEFDEQIESIISYIKENLNAELTAELISRKFFISKHYLMHKFKNVTGSTLHNYIVQKRLFHVTELMKNGIPVTKAAAETGFGDYSSFLRAFKKCFHCTPSQFSEKGYFVETMID